MKRADFLNKTIRYLLLPVLTLIVFVLGRKVVYGSDCNSCPQNGACNKVSCDLPVENGGKEK